ncbi:hypothetical protein [Sphingopyxis sp. QXT-31]|uniref:hypothetical protein n=1 Tax=Sphingopyxis sp. QXT-31 TaxID=1357916 RepID=UPI0012EB4A57|nr:hypothetical protein [Sphingopyxis sp. QXT-31]
MAPTIGGRRQAGKRERGLTARTNHVQNGGKFHPYRPVERWPLGINVRIGGSLERTKREYRHSDGIKTPGWRGGEERAARWTS